MLAFGDAENDLPFFEVCGWRACPADGMAVLKERADWIFPGENGAAVAAAVVGPVLQGLLPVQLDTNELAETPSARSIAANLARLEQAEPDLLNAVMGSRLSSARVMAASADLGSDDAMDSSGQRYRLIARYADHSLSPEPAAPALVRERIARRLGDDVNDRISRIGLEGSRVSLKF